MEVPRKVDSFPDTRWSLIQEAGRGGTEGHDAFSEWCSGYLEPVRQYVLAQGVGRDEAEETTQAFFERMVERGGGRFPERLEGSFRAYLKRSLKNFLKDRWRASVVQKRGGGASHVEVDSVVLADGGVAPDVAFEQSWVMAVVERAGARLKEEMELAGKGEFFRDTSGLLDGRSPAGGYEGMAVKHGMKGAAFRVALHRLKKRFRHLIEDELRQTVSTGEDFDEELRYLLSVWS